MGPLTPGEGQSFFRQVQVTHDLEHTAAACPGAPVTARHPQPPAQRPGLMSPADGF